MDNNVPVTTTDSTVAPNQSNKKTITILLTVIAILLVVILSLLALNLSSLQNQSRPSATNTPALTPTNEVTVYTPIPTVALTTAPGITATAIPTATPLPWKDFTFTLDDPIVNKVRVTGSYPANSNLVSDLSDATLSNNNYRLDIQSVPGGEVIHYESVKTLPAHPQLGNVFRYRFSADSSVAYYMSGVYTKTGTCEYLEDQIQAPCGPDTATDGHSAFKIICTASLTNRNDICDRIVSSLRFSYSN